MRLLLDTHLLVWLAEDDPRLSVRARELIGNPGAEVFFSVASVWELAIKASLGRSDFQVDASLLRRTLLANGFLELSILSAHAVAVAGLALVHRDPFDRLLVAQAQVEGLTLLTVDPKVARYPGNILLV